MNVYIEMIRNGFRYLEIDSLGNFIDGLSYDEAANAVESIWGANSPQMEYVKNFFNVKE